MIRIMDPYNLMPELFECFPEHLIRHRHMDADVRIMTTWDREAPGSDQLTIVLCPEPDHFHAHVVFADLIARRPNAIWLITSRSSDQLWQVPSPVFFPAHMVMTVRANPNDQQWQPGGQRYTAAALLGGWGKERARLFDALRREQLLEHCLVNFRRRPDQSMEAVFEDRVEDYQSAEIPFLDDPVFQSLAYRQGGINTMAQIHDTVERQNWISQIVPWNIYQACWINLVAETSTSAFMPTEKIAKPILAGQPWLVMAGQGFLQSMQQLGFQTFDRWWDETYDHHGSYRARIDGMMRTLRQVHRMTDNQRLEMILDMRPVLEHNRRLILDLARWHQPVLDAIQARL